MGTPGVCWDTLPISPSGTLAKSHSLWLAEKGGPAYASHCSAAVSVTTGEATAAHRAGSAAPAGPPRRSRFGPMTCSMQATSATTLDSFNLSYASPQAMCETTCNALDVLDPSYSCTFVFLVWSSAAPHALCPGLHGGPQGIVFQCSAPVSANTALSGDNDPCR